MAALGKGTFTGMALYMCERMRAGNTLTNRHTHSATHVTQNPTQELFLKSEEAPQATAEHIKNGTTASRLFIATSHPILYRGTHTRQSTLAAALRARRGSLQ